MSGLVRRLLGSSRYFIVVAVIGSFVASASAIIYGGFATFFIVVHTFGSLDFSTSGAKVLSVDLVTMIDLFLIGTVLYIIAVGLYELFIDAGLPMPAWLKITTLDDLKERLLGLVAVLLAVTFLGSAVTWNGSTDILALGIAIGVVLGVVSLTIAIMARTHVMQAREHDRHEPLP
jgi:uncharacterized membrane protein YqhA